MAATARLRRSSGAMPCASRPISTFSSTVSQGNSAKLWNTIATSPAGPETSAPPMVTLPEVAGIRPAMIRSSVDFPQPERPSSATISLSLKVTLTSSSTSKSFAPPLR